MIALAQGMGGLVLVTAYALLCIRQVSAAALLLGLQGGAAALSAAALYQPIPAIGAAAFALAAPWALQRFSARIGAARDDDPALGTKSAVVAGAALALLAMAFEQIGLRLAVLLCGLLLVARWRHRLLRLSGLVVMQNALSLAAAGLEHPTWPLQLAATVPLVPALVALALWQTVVTAPRPTLPRATFRVVARRVELGLACGLVLGALALLHWTPADSRWLRADGTIWILVLLTAVDALARRWRSWRTPAGDVERLLGGMLQLTATLVVILAREPLVSWVALVIAAGAALYPMRRRVGAVVPPAGVGALLTLFGFLATQLGAPMPGLGMIVVGLSVVGWIVPALLPALLGLVLTLSDSMPPWLCGPLFSGAGLGMSLACGAGLMRLGSHGRPRADLLALGHAGIVVFAFGLGRPEGVFAGLVLLTLSVLARSAVRLATRHAADRIASLAALGGFSPVGVFPGLILVLTATATQTPWLLPPLGLVIVGLGWPILRHVTPPRWSLASVSPALLPLAALVVVGWLLPDAVASWLHDVAATPAWSGSVQP